MVERLGASDAPDENAEETALCVTEAVVSGIDALEIQDTVSKRDLRELLNE